MRILILAVILLASCSTPRYYRKTYKQPSRREIKKAMKYSDWKYPHY